MKYTDLQLLKKDYFKKAYQLFKKKAKRIESNRNQI